VRKNEKCHWQDGCTMSVRDPENFKKRKAVGVMKQKVPRSAASTIFKGNAVSHYI
jgi:hypothetical protein